MRFIKLIEKNCNENSIELHLVEKENIDIDAMSAMHLRKRRVSSHFAQWTYANSWTSLYTMAFNKHLGRLYCPWRRAITYYISN